MKILNKHELEIAEEVLLKHIPKCLKVYGCIYALNRNKPTAMEVVVDAWPDFKVILCRSDPQSKLASQLVKKTWYYCMDEQVLRKMLTEENVVDFSTYCRFAGCDLSTALMIKEISSDRGIKTRCFTVVHLLYSLDCSSLILPAVDSELESRISSLKLSDVDLVNQTWKFGGNEQGHRNITNLISNFPTYCITDEQGQPVSWILLYDYCAMGMLYTLPEHRRKGYAKVLIATMAKRLHAQGFPVYCFIEEESTVSYQLFKSMGFIEDPSYRAEWVEINC